MGSTWQRLFPLRASVVTEEAPAVRRQQRSPAAEPTPALRPRLPGWQVAVGITLLALAVRLVGIGYGLPDHFHWDEPTVMNRVIRMGGGDLNPHFFYYPTLLMYVLLVLQGALYLFGRALQVYQSADHFALVYLVDSTTSYVAGRVLVAAFGAASVFVCYLVGLRFLSAPAGLIGALLLAVSPVHVASSHFITNDVPMAFFALLAYVFLWDVYRRGRGRDYLAAGAAIGLGTATKYLPVVLLVSLVLAHVFRLRNETGGWRSAGRGWPWLVAGGAAAFVVFAAASPYVLLDWRSALHDYQVQGALSGATGCRDCSLNFVPYLTGTLGWSVGWGAYLLALVGLASLAWTPGERRLRYGLLASFPVMLFLMVGVQRQPWARWLVPIAPFAGLAAGAVLWALVRRLAARPELARAGAAVPPAWPAPALAAAGALLLVAVPAVTSLGYDRALVAQDPRTSAVNWFEERVPKGTAVAVQPMLDRYFFTAQLRTDAQLERTLSWVPEGKPALRDAVEEKYRERPVYHEVPFSYDLAELRAAGVRYVVLSSAHYHNSDPVREDQLYAALSRESRVVARFTPPVSLPSPDNYPVSMPTVTVYELT